MSFWRENGSELLEKYRGFSDSRGRYILRREGDGSTCWTIPHGGFSCIQIEPGFERAFRQHYTLREVTISNSGLVSHRIPDFDFAE